MPRFRRQGTSPRPTGTISAVMTVKNHIFPPIRAASLPIPSDLALPRRAADSDKFACGRVIVVGGALGMAGAPALSAMAALRSGAGLVELHVPDPVAATAAAFSPCVMTHGHPATPEGTFAASAVPAILARSSRADGLACGPGLGRTADTVELVRQLWRDCPQVAVFDADGLWALSKLPQTTLAEHAGPRVLTPHGGELLRFLPAGQHAGTPRRSRPDREALENEAAALAESAEAVVVLKGPCSLITTGSHRWHNTSGNPGMATAGSGDVLTGVIAALCGSGLSPLEAAKLGVWVHGHAGDLAAERIGQTSLIATDLVAALPQAFLTLEQAAGDDHTPAAPSE